MATLRTTCRSWPACRPATRSSSRAARTRAASPSTAGTASRDCPSWCPDRAAAPPAVFTARPCCNTVSITDSSYLEIRNLELDGLGLDGVDAVKAEGPSGDANFAHHITIENLYIHGHDTGQQTVGISTKCPAWDWVIRRNVIASAGTGMYLGNSDGSAPFVNGLVEGNLVVDTIGYNVQIKHQNNRPALPGMPASGTTIVRHNVFSKANNASTGVDARPNLLVGHWPLSGPGQDDVYLIYGNFFWANPTGRGPVPGRRKRGALRQPLREQQRARGLDPAAERRATRGPRLQQHCRGHDHGHQGERRRGRSPAEGDRQRGLRGYADQRGGPGEQRRREPGERFDLPRGPRGQPGGDAEHPRPVSTARHPDRSRSRRVVLQHAPRLEPRLQWLAAERSLSRGLRRRRGEPRLAPEARKEAPRRHAGPLRGRRDGGPRDGARERGLHGHARTRGEPDRDRFLCHRQRVRDRGHSTTSRLQASLAFPAGVDLLAHRGHGQRGQPRARAHLRGEPERARGRDPGRRAGPGHDCRPGVLLGGALAGSRTPATRSGPSGARRWRADRAAASRSVGSAGCRSEPGPCR